MNLKKFNSAVKIFEEIKKLDTEINQIEKLAIEISEGKTEVSIELKSYNKIKEEKEKTKEQFKSEETLDLMSYYRKYVGGYILTLDNKEKENKYLTCISYQIKDSSGLRFLGLLIDEKKAMRDLLIKKLETKMSV